MQIIGTLSLTQHVKDWLGNSSCPRILHVFDRACNLINENGDVVSIVAPQIGNGPFNLIIENDILFSDDLDLESHVSIVENLLTLGNFIIDTANVEFWNPRPDWVRLYNARNTIAHSLLALPITNPQFSNSLISNFCSGLVTADISSAKKNASKLAGLGIGLTPSGDDFMMGALYAAWIIHPPEIASMLAQEIANISAPLTTSLSAAWLRAAGRGEAGILWHEFFEALISSDSNRIRSATDHVLAVGATSGADALAGFISIFITYRELEKKYVIPKFI